MKTSTLVILVIALVLMISLTSMAESEVMNEKRQYGGGSDSTTSP
ncbi:3094_t:CDS:1, partial [Dentiscutata erythropus]